MASSCDDPSDGVEKNGLVYYDRTNAPAPQDPNSLKAVLKAFTTEVASNYCEKQQVSAHWQVVRELAELVESGGVGHLVVKGGLALHVALKEMFAEFKRLAAASPAKKAVLDAAEDFMLKTYASTSDLDTGIVLDNPEKDLKDVVDAVIEAIEELRDTWTGLPGVQAGIVAQCNADVAQLAAKLPSDVQSVVFSVDMQPDRHVYPTTHAQDSKCDSECVVVQSEDDQNVFFSDNESLVFLKGTNVADFYLVRAKWSIKAQVTLVDGSGCEVACPAEMIDVAIPRSGDSRLASAADMGTGHYKREYEPVPGVPVPMVSLKYQLIDLEEMINEFLTGGNDPKIAKRIHRYIILSTLNNLLRYQEAKDDDDRAAYVDFLKPGASWRDLVQTKVDWYHESSVAALEREDFLDGVETVLNGNLDTALIQHLVDLRDAVLDLKAVDTWAFSGVGGSAKSSWLPAAVLAAVTLLAAVLG